LRFSGAVIILIKPPAETDPRCWKNAGSSVSTPYGSRANAGGAIVLPSLRISPLLRIAAIVLFYTVVISFIIIYIQSIGSGMEIFSELFISSSLPVVPGEDKVHDSKPSRFLTKAEREAFSLSADLKAILVGLTLGDLYINKQRSGKNPCLMFKQGIVHEDYLLHLYELFKEFCLSGPKIQTLMPNKITGKVYSAIYFRTYALPCFVEFWNLFYQDGQKVIPANIANLLTPLGLAY
jgi:hypothetical protein